MIMGLCGTGLKCIKTLYCPNSGQPSPSPAGRGWGAQAGLSKPPLCICIIFGFLGISKCGHNTNTIKTHSKVPRRNSMWYKSSFICQRSLHCGIEDGVQGDICQSGESTEVEQQSKQAVLVVWAAMMATEEQTQ